MNIRGLVIKKHPGKLLELTEKAESMDLDAIILNESWAKHLKTAEMSIEGFECFCGDHDTVEHSGVCIYIKSTIPTTFIGSSSLGLCEAAIIFLSKSDLIIESIYRSPSATREDFDKTVSISKILDRHHSTRLIIVGDFNFPDVQWEYYQLTNPLSHPTLEKLIEGNNLQQMMDKSTRGENILDLLLTDAPNDMSEIQTENNHHTFTDHK